MGVLGRRFVGELGGGCQSGSRTYDILDGCRRRLVYGTGILVRTSVCLFWGKKREGRWCTVDVVEHIAVCNEKDGEGLGDGAAGRSVRVRHAICGGVDLRSCGFAVVSSGWCVGWVIVQKDRSGERSYRIDTQIETSRGGSPRSSED